MKRNHSTVVKGMSSAAAAAESSATAEGCCQQGKAHFQAGDFLAALEAFEQAIALAPDYCQAHNNRGNALCELSRQAEALAAYDRALTISPRYHQAWFNKGQLLTQMGAYGNALEAYEQAIRLQPDPMYLHAREDIWLKKKLVKA